MEWELTTIVLCLITGLAVGALGGFTYHKKTEERKFRGALSEADRIVQEASKKAETVKRDIIAEGKEEIHRLRQELDRDTKERRGELQRAERRLEQKEENLDRKLENISRKEEELKSKNEQVQSKLDRLTDQEQELIAKLEQIAQLTQEEAREQLLAEVEADANHYIGLRLKELEERAKRDADRRAQEIVATAIQRCSVEFTSDVVVSVVNLPSDEMKGRIIGREGRNIRTFETLTGVDLIVDDTPEAVTLSSFDPVRREVARLSLERLVVDGRIHPARIEEIIERAEKDVQAQIIETAEEALLETGIKNMHSELAKIIGQLRYRTSYGQNALAHSLEVAHLAGVMAAELGLDEQKARRAGLLHDIGKAVDHQIEGPHAKIGADLAKRYGESPDIVNAIASHHEDEEPQTIYAVLVAAADAVSASRPGARRESLDAYVKRLEKLEEVAKTFSGVSKAFAIQAGREVRVAVAPTVTDDGEMQKLAYDIARKIEEELRYPGQIKVTLIRETRAVEYAK
ncbi:ribonuclease Y [uncultured Cloacibacillus sp.]|uniref:ribonuclease Y n=1 Tax=uncultured Cloacibacillus sp. TaxID=889794 RepID=UPI001F9693CD|nr:ribonuclease Y [uncultured Cloacibacillus sp.]HIR18615.1 ribonuclease Y [Candidatus Caccocola faecigallinarum]HIT03779.1 ribonuclease Y [Candidatus Caccocola faecipullorum]